jgi:hypothetical protein
MKAVVSVLVLAMAAGGAMAQDARKAAKKDMTFFVTSVGKGDGANYGGLEGADAYCNTLAKNASSKRDNWKAYLSKSPSPGAAGTDGVNARERIGKGPWYNAKGQMIAKNVADLHSGRNKLTKQTALTEKGEMVKGRGDTPNEHDILTGSDPQGLYSTAGGDTTCGNWTKNGEGSAIVGHADLTGLNDAWHSKQWNSSHGSRGCSQEQLKSSGGAGLLYCFAPN